MKNHLSSNTTGASSGCPFAYKAASAETEERSDGTKDTASGKRDSDPGFASMGSCPFASSLHENDDSSSTTSADQSLVSAMLSHPTSPGSLPWKECPVFANRSCPFKDAKSPDDVSQILMQLPPSHTDQTRPTHAVLVETLAYFHRDQAMEEYSFSSILTRLVKEHHSRQLQGGKDECEDYSIVDGDDLSTETEEFRLPQMSPQKESNDQNEHEVNDGKFVPQEQSRGLSEALKTGTEEAHREAESVHFVKNFIRGKIDRRMYALFVAQLFHVYRHLEAALEEHARVHFAECHFPNELNRSEALKEDMDFWQGSNVEPPISPATQDYLDRLDQVAKERPLLLLAHAYTRYLGDLSGGKILARVAKRALNLDKGDDGLTEGLAFYDFPLLRGSVKAFKDKYRQALNDLQFNDTDEAVHAIVQEANVAFLLNMRLFEELDVKSSVPGASVRPIEQVYSHAAKVDTKRDSRKEGPDQKIPSPCPFVNSNGASGVPNLHHHHDSSSLHGERKQEHHTKQCPWPFILLHDPITGMKQWQTWLTIGLIVTYIYQQYLDIYM